MQTYAFNKPFIYFVCIVSAMGGLLFGYDWVVIGGAKIFYEQFFGITDNNLLIGLATSIALAGCMVGALTVGALTDRFGRKPLLIYSAICVAALVYFLRSLPETKGKSLEELEKEMIK